MFSVQPFCTTSFELCYIDHPASTMTSLHQIDLTKLPTNSLLQTRMHSSRMCTARSLTIGGTCPGGVPAWGGCTCWGVCICSGMYLLRGFTCPEGVPAQGVYLPGGECVPAQGGCVYLPGDVPAQGDLPPRTEFLTHATENITLPQLRCRQ